MNDAQRLREGLHRLAPAAAPEERVAEQAQSHRLSLGDGLGQGIRQRLGAVGGQARLRAQDDERLLEVVQQRREGPLRG